jgi:hypothetical protein
MKPTLVLSAWMVTREILSAQLCGRLREDEGRDESATKKAKAQAQAEVEAQAQAVAKAQAEEDSKAKAEGEKKAKAEEAKAKAETAAQTAALEQKRAELEALEATIRKREAASVKAVEEATTSVAAREAKLAAREASIPERCCFFHMILEQYCSPESRNWYEVCEAQFASEEAASEKVSQNEPGAQASSSATALDDNAGRQGASHLAEEMADSDFRCSICFEPLACAHVLECGHNFCFTCIHTWLAQKAQKREGKGCPECREAVTREPFPVVAIDNAVPSPSDCVMPP